MNEPITQINDKDKIFKIIREQMTEKKINIKKQEIVIKTCKTKLNSIILDVKKTLNKNAEEFNLIDVPFIFNLLSKIIINKSVFNNEKYAYYYIVYIILSILDDKINIEDREEINSILTYIKDCYDLLLFVKDSCCFCC